MEELVRGSTFVRVPWDTHRPDAMLQPLYSGDYLLDSTDHNYMKHYKANAKNAKGVSCIVPLESPHNVPSERLSKNEIPCYFLSEGTSLSEGLALIYTHKMKLRFPSGEQTGLHFVIAPMTRMTRENYEQAVKSLGWQLCSIKASAEMIELVSLDDDLDGIEDFRMCELYWLMEIWYTETTYVMDRLHTNDIHTWIALDKPTFKDLLQHESRAYIVFTVLSRMNSLIPISHVTELMYLGDLLGELEDTFGWKSTEFCQQSKGEGIQQASGGENIPRDVTKWNQEHVTTLLRSSLNIDEKYIKKIQEQEIDGSAFLLLKEEMLIRKPGPFEFPYGPAITITEFADTFRKREERLRRRTLLSTKDYKDMFEGIIGETIDNARQIESSLNILLVDKTSEAPSKRASKPTLKWTIEERFMLLETVLEYLPSSLPWSKIAEKFEDRSPSRSNSACRNQWLRRRDKGLAVWLLKNNE